MKALIHWFIDNPVAANLLMLFVGLGGALTLLGLKQEVFPDAAPDLITVTLVHPGATPEEVEEGICIKIEEAVDGLDGVKRITSSAGESVGTVSIELFQSADKQSVLDDVKTRVDAISTFPEDAEKPMVVDVELPSLVMDVNIHGRIDPVTLKRVAQEVRDDLAALPTISKVDLTNATDYEVAIEVSEDALRRYGLTFDEVARAVRQESLNLAGGTVKTSGGDILLRSDTQAYVGEDFERVLLLRSADGARVVLGDVANVVDGFADVDRWSTLDGEPALTVAVFRSGDQSTPTVAKAVLDYIEDKTGRLPEGVSLSVGKDWSKLLEQRRSLLLRNGFWGLILIFILLTLFLRPYLAFWVALGIPIAMMGAIWLLPATDTTLNMMSLFGFIVVLGILVDDAIVVGENIYHHNRAGLPGKEAAKKGTGEVMLPVVLAVLTTIAAFVPMLTLPGWMGKFARVIPIVVICALIFSLVESLLILPRHLIHMKTPREEHRPRGIFRVWAFLTGLPGRGLMWWVEHVYRPVLGMAMRWRYLTFAVGVAAVVLTAGLFGGGYVKFSFFPPVEGDEVLVTLTMHEGTPAKETGAALSRIVAELEEIKARHAEAGAPPVVKHVLASVGAQPATAEADLMNAGASASAANLGEAFIELHPAGERGDVTASDVMRDLRDGVGDIPGVRELKFEIAINHQDAPISVQLRSDDIDELRVAADRLRDRLGRFEGTFDITDDMVAGKREVKLYVTPAGEALGLTQAELAKQVRQGFYGDEAQRIQRGRDDVKVMVRYPAEERRSLADLDNARVRLPGGGEVPFTAVARAEEGRGPASIHRAEGGRTVTVSADVDLAVANANAIVGTLRREFLPEFSREFPDLTWTFTGEQREQSEALTGLRNGSILAMLLIFTLLALAFGSFSQPLIVLLAIPFGMVGAVLGHWLLGHDLTMLSAIGLLAMAGVVVNDSMIMIDFVNRSRRAGMSAKEAVEASGPRRFRPIILTSLTTFAGLTPLLLETSVQAQFLIPMAISLSFGVLFSTFVILLVVPAAYLILEDLRRFFRREGDWQATLDPSVSEPA